MYIYYSCSIYLSEYRKFIAKYTLSNPSYFPSLQTLKEGKSLNERRIMVKKWGRHNVSFSIKKCQWMSECYRDEKKSNFLFHILLFVVISSLPWCQASNSFLSLLFFVSYTQLTEWDKQSKSFINLIWLIYFFMLNPFLFSFTYSYVFYFVILRAGFYRKFEFGFVRYFDEF